MSFHRGIGLVLALAGAGCSEPEQLACEERAGASDELTRVELTIESAGEDPLSISAEVAQGSDRETAWAGRRCGMDGLLWVPDAIESPSIALCDLRGAVDLILLREGRVVATDPARPPCSSSCDECPRYGQSGPAVDAVLWLPAGEHVVNIDDQVLGMESVMLPTAETGSGTESGSGTETGSESESG